MLTKYAVQPDRFLMIGNALRSDILPVVAVGGHAIHIPTAFVWAHEHDNSADSSTYTTLEHIGQLLSHIQRLETA